MHHSSRCRIQQLHLPFDGKCSHAAGLEVLLVNAATGDVGHGDQLLLDLLQRIRLKVLVNLLFAVTRRLLCRLIDIIRKRDTVHPTSGDLAEQRRATANMTEVRKTGHFLQSLVERVFKALLPRRWLLADHQADNLIFGELEVFTQQQIFNVSVTGAGEFY